MVCKLAVRRPAQWRWVLAVPFMVLVHSIFVAAFAQSSVDAPLVEQVDTALVVAVDVSQSVDEKRYRLQLEGIATALEDKSVIDTILSGPNGSILFTLVGWADNTNVAISWRRIASAADAASTAALIRGLPPLQGEFTCLGRMMSFLKDRVLTEVAGKAVRTVVDVSGDGIDNCTDRNSVDEKRDYLLSSGVTINGLPIIVPGENDIVGSGAYRAPGYDVQSHPVGPDTDTTTLDVWYRDHVIGGPGAFILPAQGYADFGRAFRQKFVIEISGLPRGAARMAESQFQSQFMRELKKR